MEEPPLFNLEEEDEALYNYLNSLPPLKINKYAGASLNSLSFDSSPPTSFDDVLSSYLTLHDQSILLIRNFEALNSIGVIFTKDYLLELCSQPGNSGDEDKYFLGFLGMQEPKDTNVQEDSMRDLVEAEANIEVLLDCDCKNNITNMQPLTLTDSNSIKRGNDEVLCLENNKTKKKRKIA